jgi:hypothetical protein
VEWLDRVRPQLVTVRSSSALRFALIVIAGACSPASDQRLVAATPSAGRVDSVLRAHQDVINRKLPGYVVDSILPVEEELRRFRLAVAGLPANKLRHGSGTREALVRRFVRALVIVDSTELKAMLLDPREFADLVYPESPYTRPPYRQAPGLVWNQIQNPNRSGLTRLVRRLGGRPLEYEGHTCAARPDKQGRNLIWTGCIVRLVDSNGDISKHRLFGSIIERERSFKFVSYTNEF